MYILKSSQSQIFFVEVLILAVGWKIVLTTEPVQKCNNWLVKKRHPLTKGPSSMVLCSRKTDVDNVPSSMVPCSRKTDVDNVPSSMVPCSRKTDVDNVPASVVPDFMKTDVDNVPNTRVST